MDDNTAKLLEQLAAKLNTTAEHLWAVMVRQARIEFYSDLVLCVLFVIGAVASLRFAKLCWRKIEDDQEWMVGVIGFYIAAFALTLTTVIFIPLMITEYLNPEYWALQQILHEIK